MQNRLIFGTLLIAVLAGLLYADARLGAAAAPAWLASAGLARLDGAMVAGVMAALAMLGMRELRRLLAAAGHEVPLAWLWIAGTALVLAPFAAANGDATDMTTRLLRDGQWSLGLLVAGLAGGGLALLRRRKAAGGIAALSATAFTLIYLGVLPAYIVRLRVFGGEAGLALLIYFIVTVKLCDIGAYFTGYFLGRHKLIEWLSPKKTIEGLAGGMAASTLFAVGASLAARQLGSPDHGWAELLPAPGMAAVFGVLMALVGQLGDLLESLIKRDAGAKDSASAIPAFGGVLDVLDSPLLTAPLACWLLLK